MIENEKQYEITKQRLAEFRQALDRASAASRESKGLVDMLAITLVAAYSSVIKGFEREIAEYEQKLEHEQFRELIRLCRKMAMVRDYHGDADLERFHDDAVDGIRQWLEKYDEGRE